MAYPTGFTTAVDGVTEIVAAHINNLEVKVGINSDPNPLSLDYRVAYLESNAALLPGRAGGQTLDGGTGSGENLTLMSTVHATKGKILFGTSAYDEVNNRLGIGTASPTKNLDVETSAATNIRVARTGNAAMRISASLTGSVIVDTAHPLLLGTDSVERIRIAETTGNVGIGNASPGAKLHIQGSGAGNMRLGEYASDNSYSAISLNGVDLSNSNLNFLSKNADHLWISRQTGKQIKFSEAMGPAQMVINTGGNVGIGTTSPDTAFHVVGSIKMVDGAQGLGKVMVSDANGVGAWVAPGLIPAGGWTDDGTVVRLTTSTDQVSIGTATPWAGSNFQVTSPTGTYIVGSYSAARALGNAVHFFAMDSIPQHIGDLAFKSNNGTNNASTFSISVGNGSGGALEALTILTSGNVGIGTTSPTHALTFPVSSTGIALYNTADQTTNYDRAYMKWDTNIFKIAAEKGGSGLLRDLQFGSLLMYADHTAFKHRFLFAPSAVQDARFTQSYNIFSDAQTNSIPSGGGKQFVHYGCSMAVFTSTASSLTSFYATGGIDDGRVAVLVDNFLSEIRNRGGTSITTAHGFHQMAPVNAGTTQQWTIGQFYGLKIDGFIDNNYKNTLHTNDPYGIYVGFGATGQFGGRNYLGSRLGINQIDPSYMLDAKGLVGFSDIYSNPGGAPNNTAFSTGGTFTGTTNRRFRIQIDGVGSPNTFKWSKDNGSTWDATGVAITGAAQTLTEGVTITFLTTTGKTIGWFWNFTAFNYFPLRISTFNDVVCIAATQDGNVGIGTVAPATKLDIDAGAITMNGMTAPATPAADRIALYVTASGTTPNRAISFCMKDETGTETVIKSVLV